MVNIVDLVKNYRSTRKNIFDSWIDPALFWATTNAAILFGGDKVLDIVSHKADSHEGALMLGTYVGLAATLAAANRYIINPVARRIHNLDRDAPATVLSWLRTAASVAGIAALSTIGNVRRAYNNYSADAQRVASAFSRDVAAADATPTDTAAVLPPAPIASGRGGDQMLTGALEGFNMGQSIPDNLHYQYTGITGIVPHTVSVDFAGRLGILWDRKSNRGASDAAEDVGKTIVAEYAKGPHTRMTLDDYIHNTDRVLDSLKRNIDPVRLGEIRFGTKHPRRLNTNELALLRNVANSIDGKGMLAYATTELLSGANGAKNVATFDFLLRNAGREYLESLPALHDKYASFGLFQLTSFAVREDSKAMGGATIISSALPPAMRLPGSVSTVRGDDHIKGAYLLAIHNIGTLISQLKTRAQFDALERASRTRKADIIEFIATAHNNPASARAAAKRWLDHGARSDYTESTSGDIRGYSQKTAANYAALHGGYHGAPHITIDESPAHSSAAASAHHSSAPEARPSTSATPSLFTIVSRPTHKNNRGLFRHVVRAGETLNDIADAFNSYDAQQGNQYQNVAHTDIVHRRGSAIEARLLKPGETVYVRAHYRRML